MEVKEINYFITLEISPATARRLAIACRVAGLDVVGMASQPKDYQLVESTPTEVKSDMAREFEAMAVAFEALAFVGQLQFTKAKWDNYTLSAFRKQDITKDGTAYDGQWGVEGANEH